MGRLATEKTHEPTPYRRQIARREGRFPRSAEIVGAVVVGGFVLSTPLFVGPIWQVSRQVVRESLSSGATPVTDLDVMSLFYPLVVAFGPILASLVGGIFLLAVLANVVQFSVGWKPERLLPNLARLHPTSRISSWFSLHKLLLASSSLTRLLTTLTVVGVWLWSQRESMAGLSLMGEVELFDQLVTMGTQAVLVAICCIAAWSGLDYLIHWRQLEKSLRMTPQEVRDEARRRDGDPLLKTTRRAKHAVLSTSPETLPIDGH